MHFSRLSPSERWKIVFLRTENHLSLRDIAKKVRCSINAVQKVLARYYTTEDVSERHRSGRPTIMNNDALAALEKLIISHPNYTASALSSNLHHQIGVRINVRTIQRARKDVLGFHSVHERIQQSLTRQHMAARVSFAQTHLNNNFHYVCFSDEKVFALKHTNNVIWMRPGDFVRARQVHDIKCSVTVWGCVWYSDKSSLHTTSKTINRHIYTDILATHLLPSMPTGARYIFQHDNARPHVAKHTQNWLSQFGVELLPNWPAHSPEFNAIEYVWSWMASYVNMQSPIDRASLKRAIRLAWDNIPQEKIQAYINHIPTVCREVIAANGDHI